MPRINLLPWRAELRQKRKKEFLVALLGAAIVGALLVYAWTPLPVKQDHLLFMPGSQQGNKGP